MKNSLFRTIFVVISITVLFSSCRKKSVVIEHAPVIPEDSGEKEKLNDHTWYYFTGNDYLKIDMPQNVPAQTPLPWTEAIRISSTGNPSGSDSEGKAYALVNRLGLICFEDSEITLSKDSNFFNNRTADNLVFVNDTPVFSVYKSSFFNETISDADYKNDVSQHLFLLQFNPEAKVCYPMVNCNNLVEEIDSEVTDLFWNGYDWLCSVKTLSKGKTSFSYIKWEPSVSLLELSPGTASDSISVTKSSQSEFRNLKTQLDYSKTPERIKALVSSFAQKKSFYIQVKTADGTSPKTYYNEVKNSAFAEKPLKASAILEKSWSAALFEDGTLYLEGALPGKHILRDGKPIAIRLPKLPAGFLYSDFVISGTNLYAAWEETSFYNTARSGFLAVNLDKTLYSKLR